MKSIKNGGVVAGMVSHFKRPWSAQVFIYANTRITNVSFSYKLAHFNPVSMKIICFTKKRESSIFMTGFFVYL